MQYAVVFEKAENNWAAYVPDLPGCVCAADTLDACKAEIADAIKFHIEGMKADGETIPPATSVADYVAA